MPATINRTKTPIPHARPNSPRTLDCCDKAEIRTDEFRLISVQACWPRAVRRRETRNASHPLSKSHANNDGAARRFDYTTSPNPRGDTSRNDETMTHIMETTHNTRVRAQIANLRRLVIHSQSRTTDADVYYRGMTMRGAHTVIVASSEL